jgi:hypothetical protein
VAAWDIGPLHLQEKAHKVGRESLGTTKQAIGVRMARPIIVVR